MGRKLDTTPESSETISERLKKSLSRTDNQFSLFFALVNFPEAVKNISAKLIKEIQRPVIEISIVADELKQTTLDHWLERKLEKAPKDSIIFLYDFAELLPPERKILRNNLQQINWRRSSLSAIQRPLVIWLPHYAIDLLAKNAPDFYDWYSNVYDYSTDAELLRKVTNQYSQNYSEDVNPQARMSYKEKKQSINTLKSLLDESSKNNQYRALLLNELAYFYSSMGEHEDALSYFQESYEIFKEAGDKKGEGSTLNNISLIFKAKGDYKTALRYLEKSLSIRQEVGDKAGEGTTLNNMATTAHAKGDYQTALKYLEQSLSLQQEIGDKAGEGATLNNISQTYDAKGEYKTALKYLEQSLSITRETANKAGEGVILNNISQIYHTQGDYKKALKYLKQSLSIRQEVGDKVGEGATLNNISRVFLVQGDYKTALKYLENSLSITREVGNKASEGRILNNISQIYHTQGDYKTALKYLEWSLSIQQKIGDKAGEGITLNNISQIYDDQGDYETALNYLDQSLNIQKEIGDIAGSCATLFNMGHIYLQNKQKEKAYKTWGKVYALAKPRQLSQALNALEGIAKELKFTNGLKDWKKYVDNQEILNKARTHAKNKANLNDADAMALALDEANKSRQQ